jgi:Yip1 domain
MSAAASAPSAPAKGLSEFARLSGILWEPGATFRDIAARPRWWPPLVVVIALSLVFSYTFTQRGGWEHFFRQQMETNSRMQNLPADQREQTMAMQVKVGPYFAYGGAIIGIPCFALIAAGIFLFLFRTLLGAQLSFKQVFAICCYSFIPLIFSTLMALAVMLLKEPDQFDLQNPILTNIGAFMDSVSTPKWLYTLASSVDAFSLWVMVLMATGLSAAARKISWTTSFMCVLGTWLVYVLLKVGGAAVSG